MEKWFIEFFFAKNIDFLFSLVITFKVREQISEYLTIYFWGIQIWIFILQPNPTYSDLDVLMKISGYMKKISDILALQTQLLVIRKLSEPIQIWPLHSNMSIYLCTYSLVIDPEWHPRDNDNHEARNIYGKDEKRQLPGKNQFNTKTTVRAWNSQKIDIITLMFFLSKLIYTASPWLYKGPTVTLKFFAEKYYLLLSQRHILDWYDYPI